MCLYYVHLRHLCCCCCYVASVVSDPVQPHRWQPTRLPRPWDFPGNNTGVGCHFLPQCRTVKSESEVAQSCLTLSDPMEPTRLLHPWDFPGKSTGVGCHCLLQINPAAAATAKSLQSCPTLCNPIDSSPPGSPIPGILQAGTLEWVAISFSNAGQ